MGVWDRITAAGAALFGSPDPAASLAAGLQSSYGPSGSVGDPNSWMMRAWGMPTQAGVEVSEWSALNLPVVFAAISIIADNLAQLPLNVMRVDSAGNRQVQAKHPLQMLLHDQPNEDMTSYMTRQTVSHHALAWGNGYLEVERNRGGDPVALWPLYPDRTWPYKPPGGRLVYRTSVNGASIELPPDDVLHIPAMGFDGYRGYSPIQVGRQAIGLGLAAQEFGAKFFRNDARSGGFLMHPGKLGDAATKNIADSFEQQGGLNNAFRVKVLEEGMKYVPTTIPPDDAQFLATREFQVAEIARLYRVPLVLLNSMEKSTAWGSGIEQMIIGYVVFTLTPWVERWEQELKRKLLTSDEIADGFYIKFNLNALLRGDMKARAEFYKNLFGIGALNPNEIRAYEEFNPYEGGDRYWIPLNMADPATAEGTPGGAAANDDPPPDDNATAEA